MNAPVAGLSRMAHPGISPALKGALDHLAATYDYTRHLERDPLRFVLGWKEPADAEVVGFVASALAYGIVDRVLHSVAEVVGRMGPHPARFVQDFDPAGRLERRWFAGFLHRMTGEAEMRALCYAMGTILRHHGSLENAFALGQGPADDTIRQGLDHLVHLLRDRMSEQMLGGPHSGGANPSTLDRKVLRRIRFLLPRPAEGSACKRLNLWLRWMVRRQEGLDPGLWTQAKPSQLVLPLDTHIVRLSQYLGLTRLKTPNWRMAEEITAVLRILDPTDPVKYDFALCHLGISGACMRRRDPEICPRCPIESVCRL